MKPKSLFNIWLKVTSLSTLLVLTACARENPSFSLLSDSQDFKQSVSTVNSKVDILWMVDNSGSMGPFQQNLVNNFNSFMQNFSTKGYDYQIAVATSDAYLAGSQFNNIPMYAKFKDGLGSNHTNVFVVNPLSPDYLNPNPVATFVTNATQGENGTGDERVFSSMKAALDSPLNTGFLRPDAFLAVIILSDEDDFSDPNRPEGSWRFSGGVADQSYTNPGLESVDSYVNYLDQKTGSSSPAARRYTVSAVTVLDQACLAQHRAQTSATVIGQRYIDMVNKTGGVLGNICSSSYASSLNAIQNRILELQTQFFLTRTPVESTIVVTINGQTIPKDSSNGWTYVSASNSIMFHGTALPAAGATVHVDFDPTSIK